MFELLTNFPFPPLQLNLLFPYPCEVSQTARLVFPKLQIITSSTFLDYEDGDQANSSKRRIILAQIRSTNAPMARRTEWLVQCDVHYLDVLYVGQTTAIDGSFPRFLNVWQSLEGSGQMDTKSRCYLFPFKLIHFPISLIHHSLVKFQHPQFPLPHQST